uniref:AAA+ ATPase domain-containing protein n=1 Tax=Panagrolaimus sp. JU765 TaxID=591449 RepID=A0AC34R0I9_9BILA
MFATTGSPLGIGLVFSGGHRLPRYRTSNTSEIAASVAFQTCMHYHTAFSKLSDVELRQMFKNAFGTKYSKSSKICVFLDSTTNLVMSNAGNLYIQRRGFRSRTGTQGFGQRSTSVESDEPKLPFQKVMDAWMGKTTKSEPEKVDTEQYTSFQKELKKLPETEQKPFYNGFIKGLLIKQGNPEPSVSKKKPSLLTRFYILALVAIFIAFYSGAVRVRLGDRQLGSFIFLSPQEVKPEDITVTFDDVRGMDEAKQEVEEIVNYLRDPERYSRLGGRLPKGVLLVGPPGTGKTLLARAIAGEAQVPFFHTSGSEFDEVLVGQGARRVRDLFERAKSKAPCIIFIDEIDSVGSKRVSNSIHPYANQTINQLLSEMDGFTRNEGVIVIGATNRLEDLDKALLRPGRFDVRVTVTKPDLLGRKDIFRHYLSRVVHETLNLDILAKGTTGFTGADIENMVNQAALKAATEGCNRVYMRHLDESKDRILMGPARVKGRFPDEEANKNTAFHEAGHTLVAFFTKDATPIHKVTIIPRGASLGHTALLPEKDSYQVTRSQLLAQLDVMMGGRVAEELVHGYDKVTTGAGDDLKRATELAINMVKQFGMSDKLGLRNYTVEDENTAPIIHVNNLSPQTTETIDQEVNKLLNESYLRAKELLTKHKKEHYALAEALLEHETLSAEEVRTIVNGGQIMKPLTMKKEDVASLKKRPEKRTGLVKIHVTEQEPSNYHRQVSLDHLKFT